MASPTRSISLQAACLQAFLPRSEEHTSELQSQSNLVCRLLLENKSVRTLRLHRSYRAHSGCGHPRVNCREPFPNLVLSAVSCAPPSRPSSDLSGLSFQAPPSL